MDEAVSVSVINLSGNVILGPADLRRDTAVKTLRSDILSLQGAPPVTYPWQPDVRWSCSLFLEQELLEDSHTLEGTVVQLSAVVSQVEHDREGFSLDQVFAEVERICNGDCVGLYVHGSWLSCYKTPDDVDLLAVIKSSVPIPEEISLEPYHIQCFTLDDWIAKLNVMDPSLLPCLYLPEHFVLRRLQDERMYDLKLDLPCLKQSLLAFADVKWLEAVIGGLTDTMACKKIYYAFRALEIGSQLLKHGRITDFSAAREWYDRAVLVYGAIRSSEKEHIPECEGFDIVEAVFGKPWEMASRRLSDEFDQYSKSGDEQTPMLCGLCLERIESASAQTAFLLHPCHLVNCGHSFHMGCIVKDIRKGFDKLPKEGSESIYNAYEFAGWGTVVVPPYPCVVCGKSCRVELDTMRKLCRHAFMSSPSGLPEVADGSLIGLDGNLMTLEDLHRKLKDDNVYTGWGGVSGLLKNTSSVWLGSYYLPSYCKTRGTSLHLPYFDLCTHRLCRYRGFEELPAMHARWLEKEFAAEAAERQFEEERKRIRSLPREDEEHDVKVIREFELTKHRLKDKSRAKHLDAKDARASAGSHTSHKQAGYKGSHQQRGGRHKEGDTDSRSNHSGKASIGRLLLKHAFE